MDANKLAILTALTNTVTAFATWEEFRNAMVNGYCPTLLIVKLRKNASEDTRFYAQCVERLAELVRAEGFKVFDGFKVS